MGPRWIKKRNGHLQRYDEARIARGVIRAAGRAGTPDEVRALARQVGRRVTEALGPQGPSSTARVAQHVVEILERVGHEAIARAYEDFRRWRRPAPACEPSEGEAEVEVTSPHGSRRWTRRRIVEELVEQAGLERGAADDVSRAVEARVVSAKIDTISTSLLRELIDAALLEQGHAREIRRLEVLGVPKPDLERLIFVGQGRSPWVLEDEIVRASLERYALDEVVAGPGAQAHQAGEVHLAGLGRPYRAASGAIDAVALTEGVRRPLDWTRRLVEATRAACTAYETCFGVVDVDRALAPFVGDLEACEDALEVALDALVDPRPEDVPPAPEVVWVVRSGSGDDDRERLQELLRGIWLRRGVRATGVRLVTWLPTVGSAPATPHERRVLTQVIEAAQRQAPVDVVLGGGEPLHAWGMSPYRVTVQVGLINLAGLALAAGRGQRERLSQGITRAAFATLDAFRKRRRQVLDALVQPEFPLFGRPGGRAPSAVGDSLGVVGLSACLRYLTGEGPTENPMVANLAYELCEEVRQIVASVASQARMNEVVVEQVPAGDAGLRLAASDLQRFPDAQDLLEGSPGWDTGPWLLGAADDPLADLRLRLWLARRQKTPLRLGRPALAAAGDSGQAERIVEVLAKASGRRPATP